MDWRALPIRGRRIWIRPDQAIQVARLELVGVPGEALEVADPEMADARREHVAEREGRERREAACAAPLDGQSVGIDLTAIDQVAGGSHAVVDVHDAPSAFEGLAELASVAGASAVVDVDHGDAAAREQLDLEVERVVRVGGGAAVRKHDERRQLTVRSGHVRVRGPVEERVGDAAARTRERDGLGGGRPGRVDGE